MDSFSRRRPPKFSEPIDFSIKESENSFSNLLVDRFSGLFSGGWSTNDQLYSRNLAQAVNGLGGNPFNTKIGFDFDNQWNTPPRSCPPIGTRDPFNSFSTLTPRPQVNSNQLNTNNYNSFNSNHLNRDSINNYANNLVNGHQQQQHQQHQQQQLLTNSYNTNHSFGMNQTPLTNSTHTNPIVANSNLNPLQASYVPPRVRRRNPTCTECVFCKNNGQPPSFYKSHILKCPEGKIICPVLRNYDCPICRNGGGERAHTLRYCPWNKPSFWQRATRT